MRLTVYQIIFSALFSLSSSNVVHGSSTSSEKTVNDLNTALKFCISQMINSGFFSDTWLTYFPKVLPTAIPNNCEDGRIINLTDADDSLRNVLRSQKIRVGLHKALEGSPYLYPMNVTNGNTTTSEKSNSSTITTKSTTSPNSNNNVAVDAGTIDGYEPACIREVTRLLGISYKMDIVAEVVLVGGDGFFDDLREAIDSDQVDVVWSVVTITDNRSQEVDFVCNNHISEFVIGSSANVGGAMPDATGPSIPLGCYAVQCGFTNIPAPFYLKPISDPNGASYQALLPNATEPFKYVIETYENLWNFIRTQCPNCSQVDTPEPIARDYRAPFTKKYFQTLNQTSDSTRNRMILTPPVLLLCFVMYTIIYHLLSSFV